MLPQPLLTCLAFTSCSHASTLRGRTSKQVATSYGSLIGSTSDFNSAVNVYKGIPFASPPVGERRWTAPTSPAAWSGVRDATTFGADCSQNAGTVGIFSSGNTQISEDCLFLNVWAPANATSTANLPVYVWIYGGQFTGGSGSVPTYDGSHLASKDIVVVTFNYRMGAFGFLAHPDLSAESGHNSSGNYGLLDQIQALTFVQEEISAFGGNPKHITVGGQSAGSASALDMMYSPLSRDKIVGVIPESGARGTHDPETYMLATSHRSKTDAEAQGVTLLSQLNVSSMTQLRNVSVSALLAFSNTADTVLDNTPFANVSAFRNPLVWQPVIDGYVLPHTYDRALALNDHGDVPILTGNNKDESGASPNRGLTLETFTKQYSEMFGSLSTTFFDLYPATNTTTANSASNDMFRDLSRVSVWDWANSWYAGGAKSKVFGYYFTHAPPNQTSGAYHGSELWYAFGNTPMYYNLTWTEQDYALQAQISEYWANFIKTGDPNGGDLTHFPALSNASQIMWLGDSTGASYLTPATEKYDFVQEFMAQQIEF